LHGNESSLQFGKQIQASQIPGWSQNYLDYKFLKKIISSLAANRPASEAAALALGVLPADILIESSSTPNEAQEIGSANVASILEDVPGQPPIQSASGQDDDRGPDFQAHKAAFFFKLERELEKVGMATCIIGIRITIDLPD
jgi:CDK inhibitor PHO81